MRIITTNAWLGGATVRKLDREAAHPWVQLQVGSLISGCVTICGQVNHFSSKPTTKVNSAFHTFEVDKSNTGLPD